MITAHIDVDVDALVYYIGRDDLEVQDPLRRHLILERALTALGVLVDTKDAAHKKLAARLKQANNRPR